MTGCRNVLSFTTTTVLVLGSSPTLSAQDGRTCTVVVDSVGGEGRQVDYGPGRIRWYAGGGVWASCRGQKTAMYADSVAWYQDRQRLDMIGNVAFRDSTVALDAELAAYLLTDERLEAYDSVRLVNLETRSTLVGPNLTYRREVPGRRDTTELYASQRPTVEYWSTDGDEGGEPYIIIGDQVRLRGNSATWAGGNVTIDRSDFQASADSAWLNLDAEEGELIGQARVTTGDSSTFHLSGDEIRFTLTDNTLDWVQARNRAEALSEGWRIVSDTVEFAVVDGAIQGGLAWGDSSRARAMSIQYTLIADSMAVDSPDQVLEEVRGYGAARATASGDSTDLERDWMVGDTVVARFDTLAVGTRVLIELEAMGHARALYRVFDPQRAGLAPDINYSRGERIIARFGLLGVRQVDVVGQADGVHLEPIPQ